MALLERFGLARGQLPQRASLGGGFDQQHDHRNQDQQRQAGQHECFSH